jgi:DNA-binding GntR family transcriptional regulator
MQMMTLRRPSDAHRQISRQSIPESLRDSLRERILDGEFAEGEALIQDAIAEEYDVSRMPVREALRQLEAMGLVAMRTHRGAVVTTLPTEDVEELFELRALLEKDTLMRAVPRMTDQDIDDARAILVQLDASYEQRSMADWGRLNWAFHHALYRPSRRPRTLSMLQGINHQIERYIRVHLVMTEGLENAQSEHRELLRLCALRQGAEASAFVEGHILSVGRALVARLRSHRAARHEAAAIN